MPRITLPILATSIALVLFPAADGAISYSTAGNVYSESFNSLPTNLPSNASIETLYSEGWRDDTTTDANHVSVPGWYLYHPLIPAAENGFNDHQRLRAGPGANTGAFWLFGATAADAEKALGTVNSNTVTDPGTSMYMALRLTNGTGGTLTSFTLTYNGEQWRDGTPSTPETLTFDYSLDAAVADFFSPTAPPNFTKVPALNFTSPVFTGTGTSGTAVNGNLEGRIANITSTVSNISWAPGADLWLRWGDVNATGGDDGLAVDDVRFVATPEPTSLALLAGAAGLLASARPRARR